jgi:glutamine amidotransferase
MSADPSKPGKSSESIGNRDVVIADCRIGNLGSVANMVKHVGGRPIISRESEVVANARRVILPGVGNFKFGMDQLRNLGMIDALNVARSRGTPILGICLGMALMTRWSEEGMCEGLGWFDFETVKFPGHTEDGKRLLVPHMGWNQVEPDATVAPFDGVPRPSKFYFVHSYYVDGADRDDCIATTEYGGTRFASAIGKDTVVGVQFHPEKSHKYGMAFVRNFVTH